MIVAVPQIMVVIITIGIKNKNKQTTMKTNNEKKKQDELMKQVMEEQMRLHPEIYDNKQKK